MNAPHAPSYPPIADLALIGDCHGSALISTSGCVDWCCFHRFDARPVFSGILDRARGGHFRIGPADDAEIRRRYRPWTNVLETTSRTASGVITLTDCMPLQLHDDGTQEHPYHQLIRIVRCTEGSARVQVHMEPRFDYGLIVPHLEKVGEGMVTVVGGADALVLQSEIDVEVDEEAARGEIELRAGDEIVVVLTYQDPAELTADPLPRDELLDRVRETAEFWETWSSRASYDGPYAEAVERSALVLKALTNAPTGAIAAAPTTSLPEHIGGTRNWDYRYTWLRDAALQLWALFTLGYRDEAHAFMDWLHRTTAGSGQDLQIMYGLGGERRLHEIEIHELEGYERSRPVRVGNDAFRQFQLDAYGVLLDTAWLYHRHGGEIDEDLWRFCCELVDVVEQRWEEPDRGIWEVRGEPRHFTSSKLFAWVAADRALRLADALNLPCDEPRWRALREAIRARILADGVDPSTGCFVQSFGSTDLDASTLLVPLVRFLPPDDPRVLATIEQIDRHLTENGLVYRYRSTDGIDEPEGAFVICSFWLVDALAMAGDLERARERFESLLERRNDVGLLAEQIDPATGAFLGNFPQSFSHTGLVSAARNLAQAAVESRPR